jgi:hypothetical protein
MPVPASCRVPLHVTGIFNPGTKKEPRTWRGSEATPASCGRGGDAARTTDGQLPVVHAKRQAVCPREVVGTWIGLEDETLVQALAGMDIAYMSPIS